MRAPYLLLTALLLAACGAPESRDTMAEKVEAKSGLEPGSTAAVPPQPAAPNAQTFASEMAALDAFELSAAETALERSKHQGVRSYAAVMLQDHRTSSAELNTAVMQSGADLTSAATLPPELQGEPARLAAADPATFDATYVDSQVRAHEAALRRLQTYAETGEVASLRAFAGKAAGVVRQHLQEAQRLEEQLQAR